MRCVELHLGDPHSQASLIPAGANPQLCEHLGERTRGENGICDLKVGTRPEVPPLLNHAEVCSREVELGDTPPDGFVVAAVRSETENDQNLAQVV
jgi:hypothetical protein